MKKIFVLYTGGTIGMTESADGLKPDTAIVGRALVPFAEHLEFIWHVCSPLIDSSAVTPQNWVDWITLLRQKLPEFDGVLVLHGTDTLAYTANLFALALDTAAKPLVLTGAQKPFGAADSDAAANLQTAVAALLDDKSAGTLIAFNGKLFPAIGSSKCSTQTDAGFDNPHFGTWQPQHTAALPADLPTGCLNPATRTAALILTPGYGAAAAAAVLANGHLDAAVLMSYGHGNAPDDAELLAAITAFTARGGLLLNISQVPQGCAAAVYAQGSALRHSGAVSGGKCNLETATALLLLAVSNGWKQADLSAALYSLRLSD